MNSALRCAFVAVAAFVISLTPGVASAAPSEPLALRWSELPRVLKGRQISVLLTDGATVEGEYSSQQADAMSILVTKTSDRAKHPKGLTSLARPTLGLITVKRRSGGKGKKIGLIAGGAVAVVLVGTVAAISRNEGGGGAGIAAAGAGGAIGIGYLAGAICDSALARPEQVVRILPDEASR